jgi:hypothetical protein
MTTAGTILIEKAALRPQCFQLRDESFPDGWMAVMHNLSSHELEEELSGWTFFYMAGAIRTTAFGFHRPRMIAAALKRLITKARQQRCNCLEIDDLAPHSFLGIPYLSVSAHLRHIQKGRLFSGQ